jgi:hypothetical protein
MTYAPWNHRILSTCPRISYSIIDTEEFEEAIELAIEELAARNPRMTYRFAGDDVILTHTPDGWTTAALALRMPAMVVNDLGPTVERVTFMARMLVTARTAIRQPMDIDMPPETIRDGLRQTGSRLMTLVAERIGVEREELIERIMIHAGSYPDLVSRSPFGDMAVSIKGKSIPVPEEAVTGNAGIPTWRIQNGDDEAHHSLTIGPTRAYASTIIDHDPIETMRLASRNGVDEFVSAVIRRIEEIRPGGSGTCR